MNIIEKKLYNAVYNYLSEILDKYEAYEKSLTITSEIIKLNNEIKNMINKKEQNISLVTKKIHSLKNLLLYGDFYYESDLCQDIEEKLRKTKNISSIIEMFNELQDYIFKSEM